MEHPHVDSNLDFDEALRRHPEIFGHPKILKFMKAYQDEIDELQQEVSENKIDWDVLEDLEAKIEKLEARLESKDKAIKELTNALNEIVKF